MNLRPRISGIVAKLSLATLSFAFALVVGEAIALLSWGAPVRIDERVLFFSRNTWSPDLAGALRYTPNKVIRSVAIYGNTVEYDVTFPTNNLGLIDYRDYSRSSDDGKRARIAIVGDSFTAGFHGGHPWVPRLRDRAEAKDQDVAIYNLGIGAVGLEDFVSLLESVAVELEFERIAIVLISNDVGRRTWRPLEHHGRLHLCRNGSPIAECLKAPSRILLLTSDQQTVAELHESVRTSGLVGESRSAPEWLVRNTAIGFRLSQITSRSDVRPIFPDMHDRARQWLSRLRSRFPTKKVVVLQLPEKHELDGRQFDVDLANDVRENGFEYVSLLETCDLNLDDYFPIDRHPNGKGYDKILECVGRAMDLL